MTAADLASGKSHTDENFPVASILIAPEHRPPIMAFYRFARIADDVADSETASPDQKLALLEQMRASVTGESDASPEGVGLRRALAARKLTPRHALDLLEAFRRDVTKLRYADWDALMDYCRYSAMPVGRFVLDVHGESQATWPANDALCAALQIVNHLQDCAKDFRNLNRVYVPLGMLEQAGLTVDVFRESRSPPALREILRALAQRNAGLLDIARPFASAIRDRRLSLEVSLIETLADDLNNRLLTRDPLCDRVHHTKWEMPGLLMRATALFALGRLRPKRGAA